jgi:RNA polymerase sigma-70 factor, ECF subfamily
VTPPTAQTELVAAAAGGDEGAYRRLVEPHRGELQAHCYRMLGSVHDAEDALQDALLRAWRGLGRFEGRSSLRSWLYRIATNTCLDVVARRPKRLLAADHLPASDPTRGPGEPMSESVWLEPFPDAAIEDGRAAPDARYEQREGVELAFIAALQHLPAKQRAVLICRDVLGFSAQEVADTLDTTTASVNSALQRARTAADERLPDQSQQATLRALGDKAQRELVQRYADAFEEGDVDAVVALLTDDAALTMPPLASWFAGRDQIATFLRGYPMSGAWRWRHAVAHANGQPGLGCYAWDAEAGAYLPFALEVLTFEGERIKEITAFVNRTADVQRREDFAQWPELAVDPHGVAFARFGLPDRLD